MNAGADETEDDELHGVLAEFDTPERLCAAARAAREAGYRCMDAYTPFPIAGLADALGLPPTRLAWWVFGGGAAGGGLAYFMQWYSAVVAYPIDVGNRPLHSWPAFVPVTFELTVLGAALTGLVALLIMSRLPRLDHPLFEVERFELASREHFFLCVEARDPRFDHARVRALLDAFAPEALLDVER
jgi:hypothetical protein